MCCDVCVFVAQKKTCNSLFSSATMQVLETKLRLSDLVANVLT